MSKTFDKPASKEPTPHANPSQADDALLQKLGYQRELHRGVGRFGSFSVAFALISVTTAVYTQYR